MSFIRSEIKAFGQLSTASRALLISFIIFGIASPLRLVFSTAFIWRNSHALMAVGCYWLAVMIGSGIGFTLNGLVIKKFPCTRIYALGLSAQGLMIGVLFFSQNFGVTATLLIGLFTGIASGFYWANRNFLTSTITTGSERDFFCNLELALDIFLSVAIPLFYGWFIQIGTAGDLDRISQRYQILIAAVSCILVLGSALIVRSNFQISNPTRIRIPAANSSWNLMRAFAFVRGFADGGFMVFPTLIVLFLVGSEGSLGTVLSIGTLFSAGVVYSVGRFGGTKSRITRLRSGVLSLIAGASGLVFFFNPLGACIFSLCERIGSALIWGAANPLLWDLIAKINRNSGDNYPYVLDRELFLLSGRVFGLGLILLASSSLELKTVLQWAPLVLSITQLLQIRFARQVFEQMNKQ